MGIYCKYYRTASPADTGKAAVVYFERQWPGAADLHDRTDRYAARPIGRCCVPLTRWIVRRYALRLSSALEPTAILSTGKKDKAFSPPCLRVSRHNSDRYVR